MTWTPSLRPPWSEWPTNRMLREATAFMIVSLRCLPRHLVRAGHEHPLVALRRSPERHGGVEAHLRGVAMDGRRGIERGADHGRKDQGIVAGLAARVEGPQHLVQVAHVDVGIDHDAVLG